MRSATRAATSTSSPSSDADLVAAQHPPAAAAVGVRDGRGAPVGVRVVGDHEVGAGRDAASAQGEVHRAGLLRVGERHGREVGVGRCLLRHDVRGAEAGRVEGARRVAPAHAVQRRVDQARSRGPSATATVSDARRGRRRRPRRRAPPSRRRERDVGRRRRRRDLGGDLVVGGRARSARRRRGRPCSRCPRGGLWLAVTITPAAHRGAGSRRRAPASAAGAAARAARSPAPATRRRCRAAKTSELCRAS